MAEEKGPRASDGILEVIAKLESNGSPTARQAIEESRKRLLATPETLEQKEEETPRKKGRRMEVLLSVSLFSFTLLHFIY